MLPDTDRCYTGRRTCKQQVTNLQGHKTADIGYYIVYLEKHIRRIATLHFAAIDVEMKIQLL